ncbi:MAG TPA: Gfo/Idh/MocA family oxidoreductase [Vicinamibacterales bacterium]
MPRLRWGLLSTARINRALIPAIRGAARSELTAVASRTLDRAREYALEWQIPRSIGAYEALLADPGIDVVYISLPNHLHVEWTVRALEAGKHVLCEKPLALSVGDVDRVADAARRAGRVAAEAFMYRHHPLTDAVQAFAAGGRLGRITTYRGAFTFLLTREHDVRLDPSMGGGSLWDVGCYPLSYANLIAGAAPTEVFGWERRLDRDVDMEFFAMLRYADGSVAQFDCGFAGPFRAEMEIVGTAGRLCIRRPFKTDERSALEFSGGDDRTEGVLFDPAAAYAGEVADIEAAALDGTAPRVPLTESRRTVQTIVALYESARLGRPVGL